MWKKKARLLPQLSGTAESLVTYGSKCQSVRAVITDFYTFDNGYVLPSFPNTPLPFPISCSVLMGENDNDCDRRK